MRGSDTFALFLLVHLLLHARETKIAELDIPILVNKDVGTLEVAVEHLAAMEVVHAEGDILDDLDDAVV